MQKAKMGGILVDIRTSRPIVRSRIHSAGGGVGEQASCVAFVRY
jgi:hypothetical protein